MTLVALPDRCAIEDLSCALGGAGAFGNDWSSLVIDIPNSSGLHCSALTFLAAWGMQQARLGRSLLLRSNDALRDRLERMGLQGFLGLQYRAHIAQPDIPFVPLQELVDEADAARAAAAVHALILRNVASGKELAPALRWALDEILDNVLRHAEATEPGTVYCEHLPKEHRIEVAVCDLGRGIYASLGETHYLFSHGDAITKALRRGITRSESIGQGNGLAGLLEIVTHGRGTLRIWTGNMAYCVGGGREPHFVEIPEVAGTGVAFSLDTRRPVDLRETWIAGVASSFLRHYEHEGVLVVAEKTLPAYGTSERPSVVLGVAGECSSTGMRAPATRLRARACDALAGSASGVTLDFTGVDHASSSFLDELLGGLYRLLGPSAFRERLRVQGMSPLVERLADVVLTQRVQGGSSEDS